ncbi:MAG: transposase [Candidatus Kapabacteria bacterium]|nr:transposase [Candidatus Kapabacteria bacterium]
MLTEIGELVLKVWYNLPNYYPNLELDEIVIMPNHIHFIIIINDKNEINKKYNISEVVGNLKSFATRNIRTFLDDSKFEVWQSRFYDRIIRNEVELLNVRNYIECNPLKWNEDEYFNP